MKLVDTLEQNIYLVGSIAESDVFKNEFVDTLLDVRNKIDDEYGVIPVMGMSKNTLCWLKRLFGMDSSYSETENAKFFWLMEIRVLDMRDGLIDFYIDNN